MSQLSLNPDCVICGTSLAGHGSMHHQFQDEEGGELIARKSEGAEKAPADESPPVKSIPPRDLVLRAVLISKGLVTAEELQSAEKELREHGILVVRERAAFAGGDTGGNPADP